MRKTIFISGMNNQQCAINIQKSLSSIANVNVDLGRNCAFITSKRNLSDDEIIKAVTDYGYNVISIN